MGDIYSLPPDVDTQVSPLYKKKVASRVSNAYNIKINDLEESALSRVNEAQPAPQPQQQTAPKSNPSVVWDVAKAVPGGVVNAAREMAISLHQLKNYASEKLYDATGGKFDLGYTNMTPEAQKGYREQYGNKAETLPGELVQGISQFAAGFFTGGRVLKAAGTALLAPEIFAARKIMAIKKGVDISQGVASATINSALSGSKTATMLGAMGKGAFSDAFAFDPHQERLSNLVNKAEVLGIPLANPVTEYLASKPEDTDAEGRFKNALEGLGLGSAIEGIFYGVKYMKARKAAKGSVVDSFDEALHAADDAVESAPPTTNASFTDLTDPTAVRKAKQFDVYERVREQEALSNKIDNAEKAGLSEEMRLQERENGVVLDSEGRWNEDVPTRESFDPVETVNPRSTADILDSEVFKVEQYKRKGSLPNEMDLSNLSMVDHPKPAEFPRATTVDSILSEGVDYRAKERMGSITDAPMPEISQGRRTGRETQNFLKDHEYRSKTGSPGEDIAASERLASASSAGATVVDFAKSMGHSSVGSFLDALANKGFTSQELMYNVFAGGAGALVGGATDINQDGKVDIKDVAYGFIMGVGLLNGGKYIAKKMAEGRTKDQAFKELTKERIAELDRVTSKIKYSLGSGTLDEKATKELTKHLETLEKFRSTVSSVKNHKEMVSSIKNDEVRVGYKGSEKPIISFKENPENISALSDALLSGDKASISEGLDVNFKYIDTEDDIKNILNMTADKMGTVKSSVRSEEQVKAIADDLGFTEKSLQALRDANKGTKNLDSKLFAIRGLLIKSAEELKVKAEAAMSGSTADLLALRKQLMIHTGIQRSMSQTRTEVGRALRSFQMMSESLVNGKELDGVIAQLGGADKNVKSAKQVLDLIANGDHRGLNNYARAIDSNPRLNAVLEYYINSLLSSPATAAVNVTTNLLTTLVMPTERLLAGAISMIKGGEGRQFRQAQAMFTGMSEGILDAWRMAGKSWKAEEALLDPFTKIEGLHYKSISSDALSIAPESTLGKAVDFLGTIVRTPGRALTAGDEFFKVINYRMALNEQIHIKAVKDLEMKGLTGEALNKAAAEQIAQMKQDVPQEIMESIKNNLIDTDMHNSALATARYNTFTQPLTQGMSKIQSAINNYPIAKLFVPFFKVPVNILKYAHERTPVLNLTSREVRAELTHPDQAVREAAQAKMAMGSMVYATGALLYANGMISGRGMDVGEKSSSANDIAGKPPYSIKIGNTWFSYNRLDPVGMMLGLTADMSEILGKVKEAEAGDIATAAIMSISRNVTSKTYLQGIANLMEVMDSGQSAPDKAQRLLGNLIGSVVPSAAFAIEKIADPTQREVHELVDYIYKRTPGLASNLPPVRNIFGEPVTLKPGYGWDNMSPIYTSKETDDPVKQEFMRIGLSSSSTLKDMKKIHGIELNPEQHDRYLTIMGEPLKKSLDKMVQSQRYQNASDNAAADIIGGKQYMIQNEISKYKQRARVQMLKEYPELKAEIKHNQRLDREGRKPSSNWLMEQLGGN